MKSGLFNSHRQARQEDKPALSRRVYLALMSTMTAGTLLSGFAANAIQQFRPETKALAASQATPPNTTCNVNPASISAHQPTNVNVRITNGANNSNTAARMMATGTPTLFLGRPKGSSYTPLGAFTATSQETGVVYNMYVTFNEPEAAVIPLFVSTNPDSGRYIAVPCSLTVTPQAQDHNGNGNNGGNDGHGSQNSGNSGWGGILGQVIGGILNSKPTPTPAATPVAGETPLPTPSQNLKSVAANGLTFRYPDNWNYHQEVVSLGGPINLRNFDNYLYGGVVPNGGATIDITSSPLTTSLTALAQSELGALSTQNTRVDDRPAIIMDYTDAFGPGLNYENQAVYVQAGSKVYKFFLSFRNGDPGGQRFVQDFQRVISSTRFTAN